MKKYILPTACLVLFSIAFIACSNNAVIKAAADSSTTTEAPKDTAMMKSTATVYTCKMHPEVISDKPGKCPKCGMDLVKKEDLMPKEKPAKDSMQGMKMDSPKN